MHAAIVRSFDTPPVYDVMPSPHPAGPDDVLVDVVAAGLHPRVRSQADGSHYTSTDELPLVPGVDGVGRLNDGTLAYFILPDTTLGSMAEQTVVDRRRMVALPQGVDAAALAAAMNPAMSSWVALTRRIAFTPDQKVLVLGATGNAGQMAVSVARLLGAGDIVAVGRNAEVLARLADLGATHTVQLADDPREVDDRLAEVASDVDVVLDYVWGEASARAMTSMATHRADASQPLTWVEIGSVGGVASPVVSAALRSRPLTLVGSGQGSVAPRGILAELPLIAAAITDGAIAVTARTVPLRDVAAAWADTGSRERIVLTP